MRDEYANAFAKAISASNIITHVNVSNTQLSTHAGLTILRGINKVVLKHLDFSRNPQLKSDFYEELSEYLGEPSTVLEFLSLEANFIGDKIALQLCDRLEENFRIQVLNLSKNNLTDNAIGKVDYEDNTKDKGIAKVLRTCTSLKGLFLHYNRIRGPGGKVLADNLRVNRFLKVFDVSFNSIGAPIGNADKQLAAQKREEYARAWGACFKKNQELIHVDISYNNLRLAEMRIINEGLADNHTVLGVHLMGNEAEIDAKGFVHTDEYDQGFTYNMLAKQAYMTRINPIFEKSTGVIKSQQARALKATNNCWICEGYHHVEFTFTPGKSTNIIPLEEFKKDPPPTVLIHFEQDDYEGDLMLPDNEDDPRVYTSVRMIKPEFEQKYYFSVDGKKFAAQDQPSIKVQKKRTKFEMDSAFKRDERTSIDA